MLFSNKESKVSYFGERPTTYNFCPFFKKSHILVLHFTFVVKHSKPSPKQQVNENASTSITLTLVLQHFHCFINQNLFKDSIMVFLDPCRVGSRLRGEISLVLDTMRIWIMIFPKTKMANSKMVQQKAKSREWREGTKRERER